MEEHKPTKTGWFALFLHEVAVMVLAVLGLMEVLHILVPKAAAIIEDVHALQKGGQTQLVMVMDRGGRLTPNFPILLHHPLRRSNFPLVTNESGFATTTSLPEGDYLVLIPGSTVQQPQHRFTVQKGKSILVAVRVDRPTGKTKVPSYPRGAHVATVQHR